MTVENKRRILIVEDEKAMQDVMRTLLERVGYEIIPAFDVATAVQILRAKPLPDLILLDLMLPEISGLELLRQGRDLVGYITRARVTMPKSTREYLDRLHHYHEAMDAYYATSQAA